MAPKAAHLKSHAHPIKITRRRCRRETTITTTPTPTTPDPTSSAACTQSCNLESHSPETSWCCNLESHSPETSWCYSASKPPPPPSPHSDLKIRNPNPTMGPYAAAAGDELPSSLSKFNSALTAGLLNPMSPPPPPDKTRSSPTLFEMMANEPDSMPRAATAAAVEIAAKGQQSSKLSANVDKQTLMQQRLVDLLACRSPGNQFNDAGSSDLMLTLSSKDGVSVCISVHRQILVVHSRFFALKLNESWVKQQGSWAPYSVEIADCDDIEVYIETLRLMYSKDLRRKLMKEDVSRVLGILRVSVAIGFDAGVLSCLEYLEAAPWAEDEEEKVASLVSELRLEGVGAGEVLKRVSLDATAGPENGKNNDEVLLKLLHVVLEGKDEKARRDMKGLVTKLLRENSSHNDLRKESLYSACDECLKLLSHHFLRAADGDMQDVGQIARQADNLHWLIDILVDRQIAEKILETWASETDVSEAHSKVPPIHRYEVSRVTARLFVGIGKREVLASKEARCMLLKTWLVPFYEDFRWMGRASRGLDRHSIEEGLSNTISTLPMALQQEIFVSWFNRFLNGGDDCPNIQRGFEVWWRRAFLRRNGAVTRPDQMRIVSDTMDNS